MVHSQTLKSSNKLPITPLVLTLNLHLSTHRVVKSPPDCFKMQNWMHIFHHMNNNKLPQSNARFNIEQYLVEYHKAMVYLNKPWTAMVYVICTMKISFNFMVHFLNFINDYYKLICTYIVYIAARGWGETGCENPVYFWNSWIKTIYIIYVAKCTLWQMV